MVRRKGYIFVLSTTLILCFIVMIFTAVSQSSVMTNTTECKKNSVIVIDCGHGGEDPGAVGVNNVYESDVNLSFGLKFNDILKLNGYDTVLTRNDKNDIADNPPASPSNPSVKLTALEDPTSKNNINTP